MSLALDIVVGNVLLWAHVGPETWSLGKCLREIWKVKRYLNAYIKEEIVDR
jgi:hypothetical protein